MSQFVVNHPSMPNVYNDSREALAYNLSSLSLKDFLIFVAKGKLQNELEDYLIQVNRKSLIDCYFSRCEDSMYFNLFSESFKTQLRIKPDGKIYFDSFLDDIAVVAAIYLFYRLLTENNCPFGIKKLQNNWELMSSVAKSIFSLKTYKNPIMFEGIILKTNLLNESQLLEVGELVKNLHSVETRQRVDRSNVKVEHHLQERRKILLAASEDQENLLHCIQFGTTKQNSWWFPRQEQSVLCLWDHVNFLFSDNVIFTIKEILIHPYAVFLPQEIIPKKISSSCKLQNYKLWNEDYFESRDQSSKITKISKQFLNNFLQSTKYRSKDWKLFLSSMDHLSKLKSCMEIDDVYFLEGSENYKWELSDNIISGRRLNLDSNSSIRAGESEVFFSKMGRVLELCSFNVQKDFFEKYAKKSEMNILKDVAGFVSAKVEESSNLSQFKIDFEYSLKKQYDLQLNLDEVVKISDKDVVVNIYLDSKESDFYQMSFNIDVHLQDGFIYTLAGVPLLLYRCLNGICEGIGEFFYEYDNKDIAVQKQGDKRKNDLKLLRHSGIFKLLLAEVIRFIGTPLDEQKKIKDFEKSLILKAMHLLLGSGFENEITKVQDLISPRVRGLIKEFNHSFAENSNLDAYYFSDGIRSYQVNLKKPLLKQLEAVLEWIMYSYGESSLTKVHIKEITRSNFCNPRLGNYLTRKNESTQPLLLFESCELSRGVFALMGRNLYDVYISGKKIQSLSEDFFSSSIYIGDNDGKINWFDLHPKIFFSGKEISYEQLQQMKEKEVVFFEGIPYYVNFNKMPKLKFLDRFWEKLNSNKGLKKINKANASTIFRIEKSLLLEVLSMRSAGINVEACEEWVTICADFDSLMDNKRDDLNHFDFHVPLKNYQRIGTQWLLNLYKIGLGGVLADDMGLGKTIQVIGFLDALRLQGNVYKQLVVVPTSLIYNWTSEIKRFAPLLEFEIFESKLKNEYEHRWKKSPPQVVIITYGLLAENSEFLNQTSWNSVFFDEAQNLKNITSQRVTAARSLKSKSVFCITGTPMENHYGEFYSLIDLCVPGALGEYQDFIKTFSLDKFSAFETTSKQQLALQEEINFLRKKISPLVLRRMKSEILEQLPEKEESAILIPFEKQQKEIYRNVAISWNDKIRSVISSDFQSNTQLQMLTALLRLRQICSSPSMVEKIQYNKIPPKYELLFESVAEIYEKGESVLIFTNFITTLKEIEAHFRSVGYRTHSIHGSITAKKRQVELQNFQENEHASILIMTLKTGGVGLNLTKASYVFHIEPWWNPAAENQATDRAHRMGQTKSVQVYRYLMKDSVEEKIQELKKIKGQAFDALFKENFENEIDDISEIKMPITKSFSGQLSYSDFQHLLS